MPADFGDGGARPICTVPGCTALMAYRCAICDAPRCWEHSQTNVPSGERFCAVKDYRARTFYCEEQQP